MYVYIQSILGTKLELLLFAGTELKMFDPMRFRDNFCFHQPIVHKQNLMSSYIN